MEYCLIEDKNEDGLLRVEESNKTIFNERSKPVFKIFVFKKGE